VGRIEKTDRKVRIRLEPKYEAGLLGLEGWSHVWVMYWFDRNDTPEKRSTLQVHPRGNPANPLTGVFATRSPVRPNLIALSLCRVVSVEQNLVEVEGIDAFDGTPVLDLKPFIPGPDTPQRAITTPVWAK
jgi:tRNA-Thr(GGU) m(6)t(6)A37 methyltransferase TsaA